MLKKLFSLTTLTFINYVINFGKQILISKHIGIDPELDIYLYVLSIINVMQFFSGPISEACLPDLFKQHETSIDKASHEFSKITNNLVLLCLAGLLGLWISTHLEIFIPAGKSYPKEQTLNYIFLLAPLVFFNSLNHVYTGALNVLNRFIFQTTGKFIANLVSVVLLFLYLPSMGVKAIAISLLVFNGLSVLVQIFDLGRLGLRFVPNVGLRLSSKTYKMLFALSGIFLLTSLTQIFERKTYMHFSEGLLSSFNYANSFNMILPQLVIMNIASLSWTKVLELYNKNGIERAVNLVNVVNKYLLVFCFYLAGFVLIYSDQISFILFQRGKLDAEAIQKVSLIMKFLVLSLPFNAYNAIAGRILISLQMTKCLTINGLIIQVMTIICISLSYTLNNELFLFAILSAAHLGSAVYITYVLYKMAPQSFEFKITSDKLFVCGLLLLGSFGSFFLREKVKDFDKVPLFFSIVAIFLVPLLLATLIHYKKFLEKFRNAIHVSA